MTPVSVFQACLVSKGQIPLLARRSGVLLYYGAMGSGRESKDEEGSTPPDYDAILDQVTLIEAIIYDAPAIFDLVLT